MTKHKIAPSILASDFKDLKSEIQFVNHSEADWLHVDVMDGVFVPNLTFGPKTVRAMFDLSEKPLDVHLMIVNPENYLDHYIEAGAKILTVHIEACTHLHRVIQSIKAKGVLAGVAINPHTNVSQVFDVLEDVDLVCLMSVNPGFGGQKFIYRTLEKIRALKAEIVSRNLNVLIEIDGGVGLQNAEEILRAGADVLVAGSSVFKSDDRSKAVRMLKDIQKIRSL